MKPGVKSALKKLLLAVVVGLVVVAGSYFGLNITEKDVSNVLSPIIEETFGPDSSPAPVVEPAQ